MKNAHGATACSELNVERLGKLLEAFDGVHLLVVGDALLDEYLWGEVWRISPEAPVPVVKVERESVVLGGAANVLRNVVALGGRCSFSTVVGGDSDGDRLLQLLGLQGVSTEGVAVDLARPTTRKTRIVASGQQMIRFDRETTDPISRDTADAMLKGLKSSLSSFDGAILADYGKGVLTPSFSQRLIGDLVGAKIPVAVDPKGDFSRYRGASLLKPNVVESRKRAGDDGRTLAGPESLSRWIQEELGDIQVAVTEGASGMTVFEGGGPGIRVGTLAREVFDVQGAGDTAMAALFLARLAGATLVESALLANVAAGVVVEKMGTATASRNEVRGRLSDAVAWAREAG